jgi:hypothetical protein
MPLAFWAVWILMFRMNLAVKRGHDSWVQKYRRSAFSKEVEVVYSGLDL